tara:strand:- start:6896 stop:7159 length:264 start_codon:yes stop_codon:yes gene_type:complete
MLMKSLSNKDVALIKKALKFLKKNQELNHDTEFRLDYMIKDIEKDEMPRIYASLFTTLLEYDFFDDVSELKNQLRGRDTLPEKLFQR